MQQQALRGVLYMSAAILALSVMDALAKWLVMGELHVFQLLAVRSLMILLVFLLINRVGDGGVIRSARWRVQLLRGMVGAGAPIFFFLSLKVLPLAEATALFFSSTFIMVGLSAWVLKEPVGLHRWLAVLIGFCGVLLITRPGAEVFRIEALYVLLASLSYAVLVVSGRWLSRTEAATSLVFYFNLGLLVVCMPVLPWFWMPMTGQALLAVAAFAGLALLGHIGIAQAFRLAPVGLIAPIEYSALIWATVLGALVFGDWPDGITFAGMAVILAAGVYLLHGERRRQQLPL